MALLIWFDIGSGMHACFWIEKKNLKAQTWKEKQDKHMFSDPWPWDVIGIEMMKKN